MRAPTNCAAIDVHIKILTNKKRTMYQTSSKILFIFAIYFLELTLPNVTAAPNIPTIAKETKPV